MGFDKTFQTAWMDFPNSINLEKFDKLLLDIDFVFGVRKCKLKKDML